MRSFSRAAGGPICVALILVSCDSAPKNDSTSSAPSATPAKTTLASPSAILAKSSAIATGHEFFVEVNPADALLDARLDVGTMHANAAGDALVVLVKWPAMPGFVSDWNIEHPSDHIPAGSSSTEILEIMCRTDAPLSYVVQQRVVGPDGHELHRVDFDPVSQRAKADALSSRLDALTPTMPPRYDDGYADKACFAAASKCRGEDFVWPPPRLSSAAAHNARFVPSCKL